MDYSLPSLSTTQSGGTGDAPSLTSDLSLLCTGYYPSCSWDTHEITRLSLEPETGRGHGIEDIGALRMHVLVCFGPYDSHMRMSLNGPRMGPMRRLRSPAQASSSNYPHRTSSTSVISRALIAGFWVYLSYIFHYREETLRCGETSLLNIPVPAQALSHIPNKLDNQSRKTLDISNSIILEDTNTSVYITFTMSASREQVLNQHILVEKERERAR